MVWVPRILNFVIDKCNLSNGNYVFKQSFLKSESYQYSLYKCFIHFFSWEIYGRTSILTVHLNSFPYCWRLMALRSNSRWCWARDSGKSGSVWRVEIGHASRSLFTKARWLPQGGGHGSRKDREPWAAFGNPSSDFQLVQCRRKPLPPNWNLNDKEQNGGHCRNKFLEYLGQMCVGGGSPRTMRGPWEVWLLQTVEIDIFSSPLLLLWFCSQLVVPWKTQIIFISLSK